MVWSWREIRFFSLFICINWMVPQVQSKKKRREIALFANTSKNIFIETEKTNIFNNNSNENRFFFLLTTWAIACKSQMLCHSMVSDVWWHGEKLKTFWFFVCGIANTEHFETCSLSRCNISIFYTFNIFYKTVQNWKENENKTKQAKSKRKEIVRRLHGMAEVNIHIHTLTHIPNYTNMNTHRQRLYRRCP